MAELIRKTERAPKIAPKPAQPGTGAAEERSQASKSYGASDRQALDKLVQTGGNR